MKLRFSVLGVELARISLDVERDFSPAAEALVRTPEPRLIDRGVKAVSALWVQRMMSKA